MNKLPIQKQQNVPAANDGCFAKDDASNRIVLIKDDAAVLMMNVIKFLDNTNVSSSEFEI